MATDFDSAYNSFLAQMGQDATAKKQGAKAFDPEAYVQSLGYKPPETGLVKGTAQSLGKGVGKAVSTVGKALEYDQNQSPDLVNKVGSYIDDFGNVITNAVPQPTADEGSQREAWFQAMESTPTSLAMGVPAIAGGALGSLLGPAGTIAGAAAGSALTYPVMQQATAQETYETLKARRPDLGEDQIRDMAAKSGYWEAGPEAATNAIVGALFSTTPLGRGVGPLVKAFGKNLLKAAPLEMAGEATTGYGQAKTLQPAFPDVDPMQEALHGANVAAYMSLAMAGGGTILNKLAQPKEIQPSANPVMDNQSPVDLVNEGVPTQAPTPTRPAALPQPQLPFTGYNPDFTLGQGGALNTAQRPVQPTLALPDLTNAVPTAESDLQTSILEGQVPTEAVVTPVPVQPVPMQPISIRDAWGKSTGKKEDTRILQLAPESLSKQDTAILDAGVKAKLIQTVKQEDGTTTYHLKDNKTKIAWPNLVDQYDAKQGPLYEASVAVPQEPVAKPVKPTRTSVKAAKQQAAATTQAEVVPATVKPKGVTAKVLPTDLAGREVHTVPFKEFQEVAKAKAKAAGKEYDEEITISSYLKRAKKAMEAGATDIHKDVMPLLEKRIAAKEAKGVLPATRSPLKGTRLFNATPNKVDKHIKNVLVSLKTKYKLKNVDALLENPDEQDIISRYGADYDTYYRERVLALANELANIKWRGNDYDTYISTMEMLTARTTGSDQEVAEVIEKKKEKQKAKKAAKKEVAQETAVKEEEDEEVKPSSDLAVEFNKAKGTTVETEDEVFERISAAKEAELEQAAKIAKESKPILRKKKPVVEPVKEAVVPQEPIKEETVVQEKKAEEAPKVDNDNIQTMKANLSDLEQQISEETDEEEIAALEEEARQVRRAIKEAGGRVKKTNIADLSDNMEKVFEYQKTKDREVRSTADGEYKTFIKQGAKVGASKAVPKRFRQFAEQIKDHFKLKQNVFIITRSDLTNSNIGDLDPVLLALIQEDPKTYFGMVDEDTKGNKIIVLNDTNLKNEYHTIETLSHELGHWIEEDAFAKAIPEVRVELENAFYGFLERVKAKDESALKEIYSARTPNKSWDDFEREFGAYKTKKGTWKEEALHSEWIAQQAMKYIQERQSRPEGALAKYFSALADKLRQLFTFLQKYSIKQHLPVPAIAKWLDNHVKSVRESSKKEAEALPVKEDVYDTKRSFIDSPIETYYAKAFFSDKEDATVDYLRNTQISSIKKIKGLVEAIVPDMNLYETIKGFFRNPFFLAEKVTEVRPELGRKMSAIVKASENKTEHYNNLFEKFVSAKEGTKDFDTISKSVNNLTKEQQVEFTKLNVLGDMLEKEFNSIEDIPKNEYITKVSKEAFNTYKDLRNFSNKLYEDIQDEMLNTVVLRYNKSIRQKLHKFIKAGIGDESYTDNFVEAKVSEIMDMRAPEYKEKVQEITREIIDAKRDIEHIQNQIGKATGYMPRIRKPGKFKLEAFIKIERMEDETKKAFEERKKANRVYMELFPTKMHREIAKKHMEANLKDMLGPAYKEGMELEYVYDYMDKGTFGGLNVGAVSADLLVDAALTRASAQGDLNGTQIDAIKKILSRRVAEVLLGESAGRHKIGRVDEYITGFDTDPMKSFQTMINNMSLSIAKSRYTQEQMVHYKELKELDKEAAEWAFEYIKTTLTARTKADMLSAKARYFTTFYFMGFNIGSAIINMTQNLVIGVPELSRYTSTKDAIAKLGKYMALVTPQDVGHQWNSHVKSKRGIAEVSDKLPTVLKDGLTKYRLSGLNFDSQTFLAMGANEDIAGGNLWNGFRQLADVAMLPFKAVESANREAALLAAMEVFAKKDNIDINKALNETQFDELYNRAVQFVDTVHFMGAGNLPINVQKSALARTLLAMQSYGINFFNLAYNRFTSADKKQNEVVYKILGMMFLLGGTTAALPMADDMNKVLRKLLGRDLKLEAEKALGKITHEEFASFVMHGVPTLFGGNISNNINIRLPFISGVIGASDLGIGAAGAVGSVGARFAKMMNYASDGEFIKALGAGSPEAVARLFRAYGEATRGFTTQQGAPVYFKGEKLKSTTSEAVFKGLTGFRSEKENKIADVRFAKFELQQQWQRKRSVAINKFAGGNRQAMLDFNESLQDNAQARNLVKPITGADRIKVLRNKQSKKDVMFEREYDE